MLFRSSPFWFNPLTFDWNVVTNDYDIWLRWIRGSTGGVSKSWSIWWTEENSFYKTMPLPSKLFYVVKAGLYLLMAEGIRRSDLLKSDTILSKPTIGVNNVLIFIAVLLVCGWIFSRNERAMPYPVRRTTGILLSVGIVVGIVIIFVEDTNSIRYALAAYYGIGALCLIGLLAGVKFVKHFYLIHDIVCGHIIFIPLVFLGAIQFPRHIQTWLLYHNALSSDVVVSDILRYARKNQDSGGSVESDENLGEQVAELKKIVQKQEQLLACAGFVSPDHMSTPTNALASLIAAPDEPSVQAGVRIAAEGSKASYGRAFSMSGLDVWTSMAVGPAEHQPNTLYDTDAQQSNFKQPNSNQGFSFSQPDTMPPR